MQISKEYSEISHTVLSQITDRIIPEVQAWQNRPLEHVYCIVWLDAMHDKVRSEGKVEHKALYNIPGINESQSKELQKAGFRKTRKRLETLFSQLCDQFMIRRNYAKSFQGFKTRILAKITTLTLIQFINKFDCNRPIHNLKVDIN